MSNKRNVLLFAALLMGLTFLKFDLLNPQKASATHGTIPASVAPQWVRDTIADKCHNAGWNIVQLQWISPQGSPGATSTTVNYGVTTIPLQLNWITYRCQSSSHVYGHSNVVGVSSTSSPAITGLTGTVTRMNYPSNINTLNRGVARTFDYSRSGGFTTSGNITITLTTRGTVTYSDGSDYCAVVGTEPRVSTTSPTNFTPQPGYCYTSSNPFTITVTVRPPPNIGSFSANCDTATVVATTPSGGTYDARLLVDSNKDGTPEDTTELRINIPSGTSPSTPFNTGAWRDFGTNDFYVRVRDDATGIAVTSQIARSPGPCIAIACDSVQTVPSPPEPGPPGFAILYRFRTVRQGTTTNLALGGAATPVSYAATLSTLAGASSIGPMTPVGPGSNGIFGPNETGETVQRTVTAPAPGPINGNVTIVGTQATNPLNPATLSCPLNATGNPVIQVVGLPYLRVYGGDVHAGSGFGSNCTIVEPSAKIMTFNRGASAQFNGAGTNIAAFAKDVINGFASAGGGASAKTLSFSNRSSVLNSDTTYGGGFGAKFCAPDYWAGAPTSLPPPDLTPPTLGQHKVVYWEGDVTIGSDIIYPAWTTKAEIPSYYLIVNNGNIYINNSVRQLDGVYVALSDNPADTKGRIYTCNPSISGGSYTASDCSNKLTINGAFVAKQVQFLRTTGTVGAAGFREPSTAANIAEVFVYGPELWVR
jgi:hypothetical protein